MYYLQRSSGITVVFMIWICYSLTFLWLSEDSIIFSQYRTRHKGPEQKIVYRSSRPTSQRKKLSTIPEEKNLKENVADFSDQVSWNGFQTITFGKMSTFELRDPERTYKVGDQLSITIQARDGHGNNKSIGGDYFRARMYSDVQKASMNPDKIIDRKNGTYDVYFTARWPGRSNITVMLVHSVEAITVIKKGMIRFPNRFVYTGVFEDPANNKSRVRTLCDVSASQYQGPVCNYSDVRYDAPVYCQRPSALECEDLYAISPAFPKSRERMEEYLTEDEKIVLSRNKELLSATISLDIIPSQSKDADDGLPSCDLGHIPRDTMAHGYFMEDRWRSFSCRVKHFNSEDTSRCLANRTLHIFSDSTGLQFRQYLENYLHKFIRGPNESRLGPNVSYRKMYNITIHFQFHGFPVVVGGHYNPSVHQFAFNAIDKLKGGPEVVVIVSLWSHFKKTSLALFEHRILAILDAVDRLLQRSPETTVIFKGGNTRDLPDDGDFFWPICSSDWVSYQFEVLLRRLIQESNLKVGFLDAWDLSNARHHSEDNIHPGRIIVGTMVDQILTHMCA